MMQIRKKILILEFNVSLYEKHCKNLITFDIENPKTFYRVGRKICQLEYCKTM